MPHMWPLSRNDDAYDVIWWGMARRRRQKCPCNRRRRYAYVASKHSSLNANEIDDHLLWWRAPNNTKAANADEMHLSQRRRPQCGETMQDIERLEKACRCEIYLYGMHARKIIEVLYIKRCSRRGWRRRRLIIFVIKIIIIIAAEYSCGAKYQMMIVQKRAVR